MTLRSWRHFRPSETPLGGPPGILKRQRIHLDVVAQDYLRIRSEQQKIERKYILFAHTQQMGHNSLYYLVRLLHSHVAEVLVFKPGVDTIVPQSSVETALVNDLLKRIY